MSEVIHLGLVSHTNAGKTTLARTLLGRDVGEVRDAPHVTDLSEAYTLIETSEGDSLKLWDTPGFGDTARLVKRLKHAGNPLGWILTQVWDRYNDRPFWCSQQAVRTARDDAHVILYLVNAAEDPVGAAYIVLEMDVLSWIGKPVIVLLNQMGPPPGREAERAEEKRWSLHLQAFGIVRAVLSLDAFARCWVQEGELLDAVHDALSAEIRPAFSRLSQAWRRKNIERFYASMAALAAQLQSVASDRESIEAATVSARASEFLRSLISGGSATAADKVKAMAALAESLNDEIHVATDKLIRLHQLEGRAANEIQRRLIHDYAIDEPVNEGAAAVIGGFVSGALAGLKADLASAGLTFGAGMIGGGILGALAAGGLARGYNIVRGHDRAWLRWSAEFFEGLVRSALLRYLAVAHFGRGRGEYTESEHPKFWQEAVANAVESRRRAIRAIWELGDNAPAAEIERLLVECAASLLEQFYPGAEPFLAEKEG
ncbi:MAG: DUF3482 domain-containing protein [Burkholderiales bacterium]